MSDITPTPVHIGGEQIADLLTDDGLIPGSPEEEAAAAELAADDDAGDDEPSPADAERMAEHATDEDEQDAEPAPEQDADEQDADDDGDDDEQDGEGRDAGRMFTVTVDGQKMQVTQQELVSGFLRQADYTKKTMAVAEERRVVGQAAEKAVGMLQTLQDKLSAFAEPDWQAMLDQGADRNAVANAYQQWQAIAAEKAEVDATLAQAKAENHTRLVAEGAQRLMQAIPEWASPATRLQDLTDIQQYATQYLGFHPDEVAQVSDARTLAMALDAVRYRRLVAEGQNVRKHAAKKGSKVLKAGSASETAGRGQRAERQARQKLARTGSLTDAAAILSRMVE